MTIQTPVATNAEGRPSAALILHRDELNKRLSELKARRDGLLVDHIKRHPELDYQQIGKQFGLVAEQVSLIARQAGIRRKRGRKAKRQT